MKLTNQGKLSNRILVFIATYNEIGNVQSLLDNIWLINQEIDVLFVYDNSTEGTGSLLEQISKQNNKLRIIHRPRKIGLGSAHHLAMIFASKNNYDVLITMDADHSHNPKDIPRFL